MKEAVRKSVRIHTREIDRGVARRQMKKLGIQRPCKHNYYGRAFERVYVNSYFANHWREYCVGGKKKEDK